MEAGLLPSRVDLPSTSMEASATSRLFGSQLSIVSGDISSFHVFPLYSVYEWKLAEAFIEELDERFRGSERK